LVITPAAIDQEYAAVRLCGEALKGIVLHIHLVNLDRNPERRRRRALSGAIPIYRKLFASEQAVAHQPI
jgi:hypothetical protein